MSKVSSVNGKMGTGWERAQAGNSRAENVLTNSNESRAAKDSVQISEPDMNWKDVIGTVLDRLKEQYPGVGIVIDQGRVDRDIAGLAAGLGMGTHLVISQKFIERLGSSTEEFAKCSSILTGIAKQLAGQGGNGRQPGGRNGSPGASGPVIASGAYVGESGASFWTAEKKTEVKDAEAKKAGQAVKPFALDMLPKKKETSDSRLSKTPSISVSGHYARLAGARTKGQVQAVLADVQKSIGDLRMAAISGEEEERIKANRALRSLNKLLARGNRKINRLNQEQLAAIREKRAEREQEEQRAAQARQEKKRLQTGRIRSDYALEKEGREDEANIRGYKQYRQVKVYDEKALSPAEVEQIKVPQTGDFDMSKMAERAGDGLKAADVTVSGTISF